MLVQRPSQAISLYVDDLILSLFGNAETVPPIYQGSVACWFLWDALRLFQILLLCLLKIQNLFEIGCLTELIVPMHHSVQSSLLLDIDVGLFFRLRLSDLGLDGFIGHPRIRGILVGNRTWRSQI